MFSLRRVIVLSLFLTMISTVLMSTGVFAYRLNRAAEASKVERLRGMTEAAWLVLDDALRGREERRNAAWSALQAYQPELIGALVLDRNGAVLFSRGELAPFGDAGTKALSGKERFRCWRATTHGVGGADTTGRTASPIIASLSLRNIQGPAEDGCLLMAFAYRSETVLQSRDLWYTAGLLLLVGLAGMLLGVWVLTRHLLVPLRTMSDQVDQAAQSGQVFAPLPIDRPDEIGRLARAFRTFQGTLAEWKQRATRLERTVDRRVSEETRRIHEELSRVERKAWTDPLTGLANRRLFDEKIAGLVDAERRRGRDVSMVMMDVDHFKHVNDTLGHAAGDDLLRFTAELLRQCLRGNDLAIRMGGDEFILVLPATSALDAAAVAQRTIRLFNQRTSLMRLTPRPSVSAGVASLAQTGAATAVDLARCADEALYQAKRRGKNQVAVYDEASGACPDRSGAAASAIPS